VPADQSFQEKFFTLSFVELIKGLPDELSAFQNEAAKWSKVSAVNLTSSERRRECSGS
jgi:hypothetical protein